MKATKETTNTNEMTDDKLSQTGNDIIFEGKKYSYVGVDDNGDKLYMGGESFNEDRTVLTIKYKTIPAYD